MRRILIATLTLALAGLAVVAPAGHAAGSGPDGYQPQFQTSGQAGTDAFDRYFRNGSAVARIAGGIEDPRTLRFLDVADKFAFVDAEPKAQSENDFSAGDLLVFENPLRSRDGKQQIGTFYSSCTVLVTPGRVSCRGTLALARGNVEVATSIDLAAGGPIVAAVTGGTQAYKNVRGELRLGEEENGTRKATLELLPQGS